MDVAAMIDVMLTRWQRPTTDSEARAIMLQFLQQAENELFNADDWYFRYAEVAFSFTSADPDYTVPVGYANIKELRNADGDMMAKIPWKTGRRVFKKSSVSGAPEVWWMEPRVAASQQPNIYVWPIPDATEEGVAIYELYAQTLADSSSSYSRFPDGERQVITYRAMELLAIHEGKPDIAQMFKADKDMMLARLQQKNGAITRGAL